MLMLMLGGGKTTLLNTLSLRYDPNHIKVVGEHTLNGRVYAEKVLKASTGYVMQVSYQIYYI